MSFSEQSDYSAEQVHDAKVIEEMTAERDAAGSVARYLGELSDRYLHSQDHRSNILQLQRIAGMLTNPLNSDAFPLNATSAFYWGQLLAYRAQETLTGDAWALKSYTLFGTYVTGVMQETDGVGTSSNERRQYIADLAMGRLEEIDGFDGLDEMIEEWGDLLTNDPMEKMYAVLGFRQVSTEVKREEEDAQSLTEQFFEIAEASGVDDIGGRTTLPINSIRVDMMESFADHAEAYGVVDEDDPDAVVAAAKYLESSLNKDFAHIKEVGPGDIVQVLGNAIYLVANEDFRGHSVELLRNGETLRGVVHSIGIKEVPSLELAARMRSGEIHPEDMDDDDEAHASISTIPLGVVLEMQHLIVVDATGKPLRTFGYDRVGGVVLNNPDMTIHKLKL